jgi:uncharacterized protein YbaA (DUF1428 family)
MSYIDGFVTPVPAANKEAYKALSVKFNDYMRANGAISAHEYWGDDVPDGKVTSFPMAVKLEDGEVVVFSWIVWPDKATRDAANEKMMSAPELADLEMPFDGRRMIFGGFEELK